MEMASPLVGPGWQQGTDMWWVKEEAQRGWGRVQAKGPPQEAPHNASVSHSADPGFLLGEHSRPGSGSPLLV